MGSCARRLLFVAAPDLSISRFWIWDKSAVGVGGEHINVQGVQSALGRDNMLLNLITNHEGECISTVKATI